MGRWVGVAALIGLTAAASAACAESRFDASPGPELSATAHIDFSIIVPAVLSLEVVSAASPPPVLGGFTLVLAPSMVGAELCAAGPGEGPGEGEVTARVRGNDGDVVLGAATARPHSRDGGRLERVSWSASPAAALGEAADDLAAAPRSGLTEARWTLAADIARPIITAATP